MSYILPAALVAVLFACIACLYTEGLWGNAVRLINVVTSALLATNFWEPVARWADDKFPSFTFVVDFVAIWGLFIAFMVVLRLATDFISKVKMRFPSIADTIGGLLLAAATGWVMVCFLMMTLHTAPLAKNFAGEYFQPDEQMFFGTAPDRKWMNFTRYMSLGSFCRSGAQEGVNEKTVFDPRSFRKKYEIRRKDLEAHNKASDGKILVNK